MSKLIPYEPKVTGRVERVQNPDSLPDWTLGLGLSTWLRHQNENASTFEFCPKCGEFHPCDKMNPCEVESFWSSAFRRPR